MNAVFFLQDTTGLIKIGWGDFRSIEQNHPYDLKILFVANGYHVVDEQRLQKQFESSHLKNGWHRPSEDLSDFIQKLVKGKAKIDPSPTTQISDWQRQIVLGSFLGNGYLIFPKKSKAPYFTISENRNKTWLEYKAAELESLGARNPSTRTPSVWKWRSKTDPLWLDFWRNFYAERQKIVWSSTFDEIKDIGLAIWFGDKGGWYDKERIYLKVGGFNQTQQEELLSNVDLLGMPGELIFRRSMRLVLTPKSTLRFLATIAGCLPDFMYHRLEYEKSTD
jgi:hypothetical protein